MSYDIDIAADETFSIEVPLEPLRQFILGLPLVETNGDRNLLLREGERLWMEIDLETVSDEGEWTGDSDSSTVNCIRLHIPYPALGTSPERDYFPTAHAIGRHLNWPVTDCQTGESLDALATEAVKEAFDALGMDVNASPTIARLQRRKPWWQFW